MKNYEIWVGTFVQDEYKWVTVEGFDDYEKALKFYNSYVKKQLDLSRKDYYKNWPSGRIDVELRRKNSLLNWMGVYSTEEVTEEVVVNEKEE